MSSSRPPWRGGVVGLLVALITGCPLPRPPGDQPMGTYALSATSGVKSWEPDGGLVEGASCQLEEVSDADFAFEAVFTRDSTSTLAWMTLNGYSREGSWDGQVLRSEARASRVFAACERCSTKVVETLTVALLSRSQNDVLSGLCPPDALDGGVPAPNDAGVLAPGQRTTGFDAVRVCGTLETVVVAEGEADGGACDPKCGGCTVRYQLRGERR